MRGQCPGPLDERAGRTPFYLCESRRSYPLSDLVAPGVRRIALPLPIPALKIINAYLVEGEHGWSLVDSGMHTPEAEAALRAGLAEVGVSMGALKGAFITHLHPDHMGLAGTLQQAGVPVAMHRPEIAAAKLVWAADHKLIDRTYEFFGRHGMPRDVDEGMRQAWIAMGARVDAFTEIIPIDDGRDVILGGRAAKMRWTPGHTDYHAVLIEERDGILFSGDHVLPRITSNVGLYPQSRDDPLGDFIDALGAIRDLRVNRVLPAHGEPFDDLKGRVDEMLAHHEARLDATVATLGARARTAYEVARDLFPVLRSPHEERFALAETLAHLRHLERLGRAREVEGTPARWSLAA
ncbi:MAG TPA: MBL fold metallo-hydrolase [Candidatus Limnocylindrales bacterium]|nr:MBL fold metallo-hydrolase [Candidatus Limnocylindrales bacterium]